MNRIFLQKNPEPGRPGKNRAGKQLPLKARVSLNRGGKRTPKDRTDTQQGCGLRREEGVKEVQNGPAERSAPRTGQHREGRARGWGRPSHCFLRLLFRDRAAGYAISGIARRVRLHIVGLRVNHQRGPAIAEHRVIVASQGDVLVRHRRLSRSI